MKKRVVSGLRPSGDIHLGNYLGMIVSAKKLIEEWDCYYFIADYHGMTDAFDAKKLPTHALNAVCTYVAAGLDPNRCTLFRQSLIPEHAELQWVLATITPLGWLERMTQFKDKSAVQENKERIGLGLLAYPVLMAADIIMYKAKAVPVGEDQIQHLELTREIVRRFNNLFGEVFPEPQPIMSSAPRILGLQDRRKMSKSLGNHLPITDPPEVVEKKIMTAITDEARKRRSDPGDPDVCNIYTMHKVFSSKEEVAKIDAECRQAGVGCVDCKKQLLGHLQEHLSPIRERYLELRSDPKQAAEILNDGTSKARRFAQQTMKEVHEHCGLGGKGLPNKAD